MRNTLIYLFLTLQPTLSFGQILSVSYTLRSQFLTPWQDINRTSATIITTSGSYNLASLNTLGTVSGTITISGTPIEVQITDFGRNIGGPFAGQCSNTKAFNFNFSAYCTNFAVTSQQICNLISFSATFTPVIAAPTSPSPPNAQICEAVKLDLTASGGFDPYVWQYSTETGVWITIPGFIFSTISLGIQDIFGSNYTSHLNQDIYFRYTVGNCYTANKYSAQIGPFRYEPSQVTASFSTQSPICQNGTDGSINISSYNRSPISGEIFNYEIHTTADINPGSLVGSTNLPAGNYYGVVTSNFGCGSLVFTPVIIPAGPRAAISASASTTSSYNGFQISCAGASDGQITVYSVTGGNGSYTYSIDGGGYQSSNIFSGVSAGNHTLTVKDGCATPTTANTSTVTITAPSPVLISSATPSTCNGVSSGQITLLASGGAGSYMYSADEGSTYQTNSLFAGLTTPNVYGVRIKDGNNCVSPIGNVSLVGPLNPGIVTPPSCTSGSTVALSNSSASGGSGNLNWEIHDSSTNVLVGASSTITNSISVPPGTYYAKVIDASDLTCSTTTTSFTVNSPVGGSVAQNPSSISCFGQTATLTADPFGGVAPYSSYKWNGVAGTASISNVGSGAYTVTFQDSKGCVGSTSKTVAVPTQVLINPTMSNFNSYNISCKGGANGAINLAPSGGTPGTPSYTYAWSTGATTQNLSGLSTGSYSVTIKDGNGCSASQSFTLTEPSSSVVVSLNSKSDVTCYGSNNGIITLTSSGGVGAISFSKDNWTTAQFSSIFSLLPAATYTISARDANNCSASSSPVVINSPPALLISSITKTNPLCNGAASGGFSMAATGGTGSYNYSDGGAFSTSSIFSNLLAGSYVLSVKDANGCTTSSSTQVLADPSVLTLSYVTTPQSCTAIIDGSINLNAAGGTSPYAFSKDGGLNFLSNGVFNGLATNNYVAAIKDNHGCTVTRPVTVNIQPALSGIINQTSPINCYGQSTGALSVNASGGTSPYSYSWSNGSTAQSINGLVANSYSVVITDSKNCTSSQGTVVTQPALLSLALTRSNYNGYGVSCQNSSDGFINAIPSGGTSPYTYYWNTGATGNSISALAAGTYNVTLKDSKNCIANLPATLSAPTQLDQTTSSKINATCHGANDGAFTVLAAGGIGSRTYSIDAMTWQSSPTFSLLTANTYAVRVKDANNCIGVTSVNISEPTAIAINIDAIQEAGCGVPNGSIQSSATGGTGTLNYMWRNSSNQIVGSSANLVSSPSDIYTLTVTDQSACAATTSASISSPNGPVFSVINQVAASCSYSTDGRAAVSIATGPSPYLVSWGNGETGTSAIHLGAGNATVMVTDANDCRTIKNFTTAAPLAISLSSTTINSPTCPGGNDGSIQITAIGGRTPYTYSWSGGGGSNSLSGISAGNYSLVVTDASSCIFSQNIDVTDIAPIIVNVLNQVTPSCASSADGSLFVQATGGNGSFTYQWNTTAVGSQINSIPAGNYSVTATDSKNCSQQKLIPLISPAPVAETLAATPALCSGTSSGSIMSSVTGGTGAYTFSRDNGNSWQTQNLFSGLSAGSYQILAKDMNGCTASSSTSVTEPAAIMVSILKSDPTCALANGSAHATVNGGTGIYTYEWINSINELFGNNSNLQNAPSDVYVLTVKDSNNCASTAATTLASYPSPQFTVSNVGSAICSYSADGSANVDVSSVQSPYLILWSSGETSTSAMKLIAGDNSVKITDANNCEFTKTFQVPAPVTISLVSETTVNPVCVGGVGSIQVTPTGGTGNFTYTWNGVLGGNGIQNSNAGYYNLVVRDDAGCLLTKTYALTDPPSFAISLGADQTICPKTTTSIGTTLPNATYLWTGPDSFSSTQGIVSVGVQGQYKLTITNSDGCIASDNVAISISDNLLKADFLTASKAHVGDTLAIIDISWPIPDQIEWQMDNGATIVYADNDYALVTFLEPGTFKIGLKASQGGCQDAYYQTVSIDDLPISGEAKREGGAWELNSITVFPNPFSGKTNAKIELSDIGSVSLQVYSMVTNKLIMTHEFEGDNAYNAEIDFGGLEAGLYIVLVKYGSKTAAIRVIKL